MGGRADALPPPTPGISSELKQRLRVVEAAVDAEWRVQRVLGYRRVVGGSDFTVQNVAVELVRKPIEQVGGADRECQVVAEPVSDIEIRDRRDADLILEILEAAARV